MKRRSGGSSASSSIDPALEPRDVLVGDRGLRRRDRRCGARDRRGARRSRTGRAGCDRASTPSSRSARVAPHETPSQALQLVDVAVGGDARIGLRHARAVEQARLARVAGLGVDFHRDDYRCFTRAHERCQHEQRRHPASSPTTQASARCDPATCRPRRSPALPPPPARVVPHATAATCRGARRAIRTTSSSPRSCCSRRRSIACCRSTRSGCASIRRSRRSRRRPRRTSPQPGGRSATTSVRAGCTRSRASRSRATAAQLPSDEATLLSFKGIGEYTAGAVLSFAFGQRAAILDTNVARVLFRVFVGRGDAARRTRCAGTSGTSRGRCCPHRHVFDFNQALMDFGATLCTARKPQVPDLPDARTAAPHIRSIPSTNAPRRSRSGRWHPYTRRHCRRHRARRRASW